jgi:hypothetical protein
MLAVMVMRVSNRRRLRHARHERREIDDLLK